MALFTGYICNNTDNMPATVSPTSHVRVRIPQFHGDPNNTSGALFYTDSQLPWARVVRPHNSESFCANGFYEDGTVVLVEVLNNDLTNLLITDTIGNYTYTSDASEIDARKANLATATGPISVVTPQTLSISNSIVQMALSQVTDPPIHDNGRNEVKYNAWYYAGDESATKYSKLDWCCAFVCWVFNKCQLSEYFYGGNKTAHCQTLYNYHKSKGEVTDGKHKAGDLIFMNFEGGKNIHHVEIAVSDLDEATGTIECVGGNIWHKSGNNVVGKETRKLSQIIGGVRPGSAQSINRNDPNWKQFDAKWKNNDLGTQTIGQVGCAMTSVAILLKMTGLTDQKFSPAVLNDYLCANNGYNSSNCIQWKSVDNYVDSWKYITSASLSGTRAFKLAKLKELLDQGYYVVIQVKNGGHYVAATGYSGSEIIMSDPGKSAATELFATYGDTVSGYRYYSCKNKFTMA